MAVITFSVSGFTVSNGQIHVRVTRNGADNGETISFANTAVDEFVKQIRDQMPEIALAALIARADFIDPARGVNFRNAIIGNGITFSTESDTMMVRT